MNHLQKQGKQPKTIYYDGDCPMCIAIVDKVDDSSKKETFAPKDITKKSLPKNITQEQAKKELHVVDANGKVYKNIDAVLKIVEEYPQWKFLATIGRLPIIKQILAIGYKIVAANRHFLFGPASRIFWLKTVVVAGLIAGLLLSLKLWTQERFFPYTPVFEGTSAMPAPVETFLFVTLLGLLATILIFPKPQKFIFIAMGIMGIFALFDQMRLQPWFYQYFFMLGALALFSWKSADMKRQSAMLNTTRLIVASIYFFSGLQKINIVFVSDVFPWMIEPVASLLPDSLQLLPLSMGVVVPFLEMAIGIGLLFKRTRTPAILLALAMIGFILFTLGPLGHNWNSVVWPWNIAMALFVVILFWKADFSVRDVLWTKGFLYQKLILVLFAVLPFLSFFNAWDSYPSAALYSGNTNRAQISVSDSVKQQLPQEVQHYALSTTGDMNGLDFFNWSFNELNVPPYPETRVYQAITRDLCAYTEKDGISLVVYGKPTPFNGGQELRYTCSSL